MPSLVKFNLLLQKLFRHLLIVLTQLPYLLVRRVDHNSALGHPDDFLRLLLSLGLEGELIEAVRVASGCTSLSGFEGIRIVHTCINRADAAGAAASRETTGG